MGPFLYEEAFGYYSSWNFVSYVQEWSILPEPNMNYSVEVHMHGCAEGFFYMGDCDESP